MTNSPLQPGPARRSSGRVTRRRVRFVDQTARIIVTLGGVGVIVAVLTIMVYLALQVAPLFGRGRLTPLPAATADPTRPIAPGAGLMVDEYGGMAALLRSDGTAQAIWLGAPDDELQAPAAAPNTPAPAGTFAPAGTIAPPGATGRLIRILDAVMPAGATTAPAVSSVALDPPSGRFALGLDDGSVLFGRLFFENTFLNAADEQQPFADLAPGQRRWLGPDDADGPLAAGAFVERTPEGQWRRTRLRAEAAAPARLERGSGPVVRLDYRWSGSSSFAVAQRADGTTLFTTVSVTRPLGGGAPRTRLRSAPVDFAPPTASPASAPAPASASAPVAGTPGWLFASGDGTAVLALWPDGTAQRYAPPAPAEGDPTSAAAPAASAAVSGPAQAAGNAWRLMETVDLVPEAGVRVTAARLLLGAGTVLIGDDRGVVRAAFVARTGDLRTADARGLVVAHRFEPEPGAVGDAVVALGLSARDRSFAALRASGRVVTRHVTSGKLIAAAAPGEAAPGPDAAGAAGDAALIAIGPKLDAVVALRGPALWRYAYHAGHPEASLRALFGRVWYEGEPAPAYVYQASAGQDAAEIKYSLVPLVHGTLKATVYAMLFAVPVAILAAIYTSEMLHPRVRNRVKPVIEMMASLPSVVLGFIAAMVIAPLARDALPAVLLAFVAVPVGALLGAHLWQLLPVRLTARAGSVAHLGLMGLVLLAGLGAAWAAAGPVERALFTPTREETLVLAGRFEPVPRAEWPAALRGLAQVTPDEAPAARAAGLFVRGGGLVRPVDAGAGDAGLAETIARDGLDRADIRLWLDGQIGRAMPGWLLVLTPGAIIAALLLRGRVIDPLAARLPLGSGQGPAAVLELIKFALTLPLALVLAGAGAWVLSWAGLDARESVLGRFNQRNTLVVGIVMGFAIIPIIYTIAEDAMSAVPAPLRSASLGCGATRWQTATRVVLPIAASGIFSACMIGLGRAAGETMIVVMATGNTASMDWSLFSGFRTLSASIAVEMPEAPAGSTHYRVLFTAGLCLFVLTFVINTAAEIVRQRFRRRSAAL